MGFSIQVPFGAGLDRGSGSTISEPSDFRDLRNVALGEGRASLRRGLTRMQTLSLLTSGAGITDVIEITPIRSLGIGAAVAYAAATRVVSLWLLSGDGTSAVYVGDLWVLAAGAAFPRVFTADSYGKLIVAHDEGTFVNRQNTKVYDPGAATIVDLTADLNTGSPGAQPVKFRGVERWLNYVIGWGYGTEDDQDRPEIVRVSIAGDPTNFLPNFYWIAGQRGDPVLRCSRSAGGLLVHKTTENYLIFGTERANFGIRPVDDRFGILGSHLAVTVGGINYRWATEGPRRSDGGASEDLSLPLDLGGTLPDALADASSGDYAFSGYVPSEREVLFCFGTWAYVLHLKNPQASRWSYRPFAVEFACIGQLLDTGGSILGPVIFPTITGVVSTSFTLTVSYTASGAVTTEVVEVWYRDQTAGGAWTLFTTRAALAADSIAINPLTAGHTYQLALRFKKGGLASSAYSAADASTWPADSRSVGVPFFGIP